jgi:hypothetical protein
MHKAADCEMAQLDGHVPEVVWFHQFKETSSASIRKALRIDPTERGSRVSYAIVFKTLHLPITGLSGEEFLRAWWWQAVVGV